YRSTTQYNRAEKIYVKQSYWIVIVLVMMLAVMSVDYHTLAETVPYFYIIAILSLIAVLLFGQRISGSKSWISLGGAFSVQPSEFVKIAVIISMSRFLCEIRTEFLSALDIDKAYR